MSVGTGTHCINHKGTPAIGHCHQCHKPLCEACRYDKAAAEGLFCNQACYDQYIAYASRRKPVVKSSRMRSMVAGIILLVILAAAVYVGGGMMKLPVLKSIYQMVFK